MKKRNVSTGRLISLVGNIRHEANALILRELKKNNIKELAPSHGAILNALYHSNESLRMADIADKINKDKSTVTALINKLSKLGYVQKTKSPDDSRITYISLTKNGLKLKPVFEHVSEILLETAYQNFTAKEKEELIDKLEKVYNNF